MQSSPWNRFNQVLPICEQELLKSYEYMKGIVQVDQIGRIFNYLVIVYFEQFIENHRNSPNLWATFFHGKGYA
jgi:hypothetical protein